MNSPAIARVWRLSFGVPARLAAVVRRPSHRRLERLDHAVSAPLAGAPTRRRWFPRRVLRETRSEGTLRVGRKRLRREATGWKDSRHSDLKDPWSWFQIGVSRRTRHRAQAVPIASLSACRAAWRGFDPDRSPDSADQRAAANCAENCWHVEGCRNAAPDRNLRTRQMADCSGDPRTLSDGCLRASPVGLELTSLR